MGQCSVSKHKCLTTSVTHSKSLTGSPVHRALEYQKQSKYFLRDLAVRPRVLVPENYRDGYISPGQFYNHFHDGLCAPYLKNPTYMLIIDFRTREEFDASHLLTSIHCSKFRGRWTSVIIQKLLSKFNFIVFYDHDGTSAANVQSPIHQTSKTLVDAGIEVNCILGGFDSVADSFPHLTTVETPGDNSGMTSPMPSLANISDASTIPAGNDDISSGDSVYDADSVTIPWMPTMVMANCVFLGRREQVEDIRVIRNLNITHVLSIGRSPDLQASHVKYYGLDGQKNMNSALLSAVDFIQTSVQNGGKILVHGIEGLNRSAAVVVAYLMTATYCILEDAYFYLKVLKPHLQIDEESMDCLFEWEKALFGQDVSSRENYIDNFWIDNKSSPRASQIIPTHLEKIHQIKCLQMC